MPSMIVVLVLLLPLLSAVPVTKVKRTHKKYIVGMKTDHFVQHLKLAELGSRFQNVLPIHKYNVGQFKGFSAYLESHEAEALHKDIMVDYIEEDALLHTQHMPWPWAQTAKDSQSGSSPAQAQWPPWGARTPRPNPQRTPPKAVDSENGKKTSASGVEIGIQLKAPWGLGRISHRQKGVHEYLYDTSAGEGTCSYVLDTGAYWQHAEFEGRATFLKNLEQSDGSDNDLFGHGSHVTGILGSRSFGVAKKTKLYIVKICNRYGSCELSNVNAGISFVIQDSKQRSCPKGVIINLSIGAANSEWKSLRAAVREAVNAGIFLAVASGNDASDAKGFSPASSPGSCVAGAVDANDVMANFTNYGAPVSIFAPGVNVLSTFNGSGETRSVSGTSMAAPHLAGIAAYLWSKNGKGSPVALCQQIKDLATKGVVTGIPARTNTQNRLAFNGAV